MTQQEFSKRYVYDASTDELGGGGFAHVYKAWDNEEECFVALKIQPVDSRYPDLRLKNEVDRAASLRHPNVARYKACYTFSTFDGNKDIAVMSYYEHGSLDKLLCSQRLTDAEREDILKQILAGVDYLHSQGIIHRDLKPQNILVLHHGGRYVPKITDFGISKQLADGESSAVHNSILGGTYSYASPEQLKETTIRKNTDLWSFGVIAYQMFAGVLPFNCGTFSPTSQEGRLEQFRQMTSGVLPEALNNMPEPWQTLIRECLVVDNTQRLTHVADCMAIIGIQPTAIDKPVEVKATDERTIPEKQPKYDNRSNHKSRWWLWLLITILLLAIGGFVGYMMSGGDNPEPTPEPTPTSSTGGDNVVDADSICEVQPQAARPAPTFTLAKSSQTVGSSSGSYSVSYTIENPIDGESVSVSVSDNQTWITNLSASGGNITFKTTDNTSTESRTGTITATYNGITRQISITQEKGVRTYSIGDYYNENGKRGVVFQIWDGGRHGKIISLDETKAVWDSRVGYDNDKGELINGTRTYADSESDGKTNTDKIMARSDSEYFDAFEWCRAKGSSWYLPARSELKQIYNNKDKLNSALSQYGTALRDDFHWSSTEYVDYEPEFCAWRDRMEVRGGNGNKGRRCYVRAVSAF